MKIEKNEVDSNVVFAQVGVTFHFHITSQTRGGGDPLWRGSKKKKIHLAKHVCKKKAR